MKTILLVVVMGYGADVSINDVGFWNKDTCKADKIVLINQYPDAKEKSVKAYCVKKKRKWFRA